MNNYSWLFYLETKFLPVNIDIEEIVDDDVHNMKYMDCVDK